MNYISTRDRSRTFTAAEAIVKGISDDGGLIVPSSFPLIDQKLFDELAAADYPERAAKVLSLYLDDFTEEELLGYARAAYSRFDGDPCPVVKIEDGLYIAELWHGPTCAFKDMALTLLPYLLTASKRKLGDMSRTLILVATSGDTGKAALEGFRDVEGTEIVVFYPEGGVSAMQKLQMVTQRGGNVHVAGIRGNFDDAQRTVKKIFTDEEMTARLKARGIEMSSANSINWGRLVPQIAYYVSAYCDLVTGGEIEYGDKIDFVVPTGNFGNILAAYYAMRMGIPVRKLVVASNSNNILTDFFTSGEYATAGREFVKTMSPSMDILVSSNLERLLFEVSGRNDALMRSIYKDLAEKGRFSLDLSKLDLGMFEAGWASEEETRETIFNFCDAEDYVLDPHTAVAVGVYDELSSESGEETPAVIVSTASPFKFPCDVLEAVTGERAHDPETAARKLSAITADECPGCIAELGALPVRHDTVIDVGDAEKTVLAFVGADK